MAKKHKIKNRKRQKRGRVVTIQVWAPHHAAGEKIAHVATLTKDGYLRSLEILGAE